MTKWSLFKSGQKGLKNNHLASLVETHDTILTLVALNVESMAAH